MSDLQETILVMAYKNRQLEWEPRPRAHRVLVFDRPEDTDLRSAVPEAFARFEDGYWEARARYYLVAGSFEQDEDAKRFAGELTERGLHAAYVWTSMRVDTAKICDLFADEVYCAVYGMRPGSSCNGGAPPTPFPSGFPNARIARQWRNTHTDDAIPNYKNGKHTSARAAVSRAFVRLAATGLLERDPQVYGIWLTAQGVEAAKELMVNRVDIIISVNH